MDIHFEDLCKEDRNEKIFRSYIPDFLILTISDAPVLWSKIMYKSKCIKRYKAARNEKIPNKLYRAQDSDKYSITFFSKNLVLIINKTFDEGDVLKLKKICISTNFEKTDE